MVLGDVMAGIRRLRKEQMGQKEGESLATGRIETSRLKLRIVLRIRESWFSRDFDVLSASFGPEARLFLKES